MTLFVIFLGFWLSLLILPVSLLGITILFIKALSDDPNNPDKPYFYTAVEPGRIKAVMLGGKVVRYLMNYAGHRFSRECGGLDPEVARTKDEYWEVEEGDEPEELIHQKNFSLKEYLLWPFFPLKVLAWFNSVVYRVTGYVFVGIWPFRTLYIYKFTRKIQKLDNVGRPMVNEEGLPILEDNVESTDHVRARVFVWHVDGQAGETIEALKVGVRGIANVCTTNPQEALFGADKWDVVLTSTILRSLASIIRTMPLDKVLTSAKSDKDRLSTNVKKEVNKSLAKFGLKVTDYQIIDFEAQLSPEDTAALTAKWRAEKNKEAARIEGEGRGQGRAAEIKAVADAITAGGDSATRVQELEALIRQAAEAGKSGGVVILGSNSESGINAALLAEVKKLNNGNGANK